MIAGMQWIDVVVMVAYLLGVTALGVWTVRKVRGLSDFLMPRRFGVAMMIMHAFGTGTSSDQAVVVASATFRLGVSGIWYQWMWLFATPFYWLIAPIMRRFRAVTTADVLRLRYDQSVAVLFALVGMANMALKIGVLLKGSGALVDACTGGTVPANVALALITVLFVVYGTAGGLAAAIATDFVQGMMTIAFSVMLLPPLLGAVGGMAGLRAAVPDPAMLSLVAPGEIGAFYIAMFALQALVGIIAQPFVMGVCAAGKTEMEGRVGFMVGNLVKRLCTIAWCLTALAAVAWYAQRGVSRDQIKPDLVYGDLARTFLPTIMPGLLGVFVAALLGGVIERLRVGDDLLVGPLHREHLQAVASGPVEPALPGRRPDHDGGGRGERPGVRLLAPRRGRGAEDLVQGRADPGDRLLARPALAAGHRGRGLGIGHRRAGSVVARHPRVRRRRRRKAGRSPHPGGWSGTARVRRPRSTSPGRSPSTWPPARWRASW